MGRDPTLTEIEFEIEKEVWNRYELADNAELRIRAILIKLYQKPNPTDVTKIEYTGESKNITNVVPMKDYKLFGPPTNVVYPPQDLLNSKTVDVSFNTITEDWNVYRLNNGARIKTKLVVASIKRFLDKYDASGLPIYNIESTVVVNVSPKP